MLCGRIETERKGEGGREEEKGRENPEETEERVSFFLFSSIF